MRVAESDHGKTVSFRLLLVITHDLKIVALELILVKTSQHLERIEFIAPEDFACDAFVDHILRHGPVWMAEHAQAARPADLVKDPFRGGDGKVIHPRVLVRQRILNRGDLPEILFGIVAPAVIDTVFSAEMNDMNRIILRMHLFPRIESEIKVKRFPIINRLDGGLIIAMVADRGEVESLLAVACSDITGRLSAVGAGRMNMEITAIRAQFIKIGFQRVNTESLDQFDIAGLSISDRDTDIMFLFSCEKDADHKGVAVHAPFDSFFRIGIRTIFPVRIQAVERIADHLHQFRFRKQRMFIAWANPHFRDLVCRHDTGKHIVVIHFFTFF